MKFRSPLTGQSGIALILTLAVIAAMMAAALLIAKTALRAVSVSDQNLTRQASEEKEISAIHLAMALLATDAQTNDTDSIQEDWADPDALKALLQGQGLDSVVLTITDELGRLQVNALLTAFPGHTMNMDQHRIWTTLLRLGPDGGSPEADPDPDAFLNPLKDYLDSGDDGAVTGITGAESDYYHRLGRTCADGPLRDLSQIREVKGADPFFSHSKESDFMTLFTVYGMTEPTPKSGGRFSFPGRININTADARIIAALLPEGMEDLAQDLVQFRSEKAEDGKTYVNALDKGWYQEVIDLSKQENETFQRLIRYDSSLFRITAQQGENAGVRIEAVIKREKNHDNDTWQCRIIQIVKGYAHG